jgi:hypothetical protein
VLGHVAWTTYRNDPANLFAGRAYVAGIAAHLLEGRNVANVTDYDERLLQKLVVEGANGGREVLVVGSSRAMSIGAELFPGRSVFNASVSGASLQDLHAILQLYREHGRLPRLVVLGVDPWAFNANNIDTRWTTLEDAYTRSVNRDNASHGRLAALSGFLARFQQLISFDYYRAARKAKRKAERAYYATPDTHGDVNIRLADGTISYRRAISERSPADLLDAVRKEAAVDPVYGPLARFDDLDAASAEVLADLLRKLKDDGVAVLLFLTPYHPEMYATLARPGGKYRLVPAAEETIRRLAATEKVPLLGSFDPARAGCAAPEFFDGMHPRPACLARVLCSGAAEASRC